MGFRIFIDAFLLSLTRKVSAHMNIHSVFNRKQPTTWELFLQVTTRWKCHSIAGSSDTNLHRTVVEIQTGLQFPYKLKYKLP